MKFSLDWMAIGSGSLLALEVLVLTFLAKKADDLRTTRFDDDALILERQNTAVALRRAGLFLGGTLAMAGVLSGPSKGLVADFLGVALFGIVAYVLLFAGRALCHALLLRGIDDDDACMNGNVSVGLVEGGLFLASGLLVQGSVAGGSEDLLRGLATFALFFALGMLVLLLAVLLARRLGSPMGAAELARDNRAAAVETVGALVANALLLRSALGGESQGLIADVLIFCATGAMGIAVLLGFQLTLRRIFLPKANLGNALRDGNVAVVVVLQSLTIAFALIVGALLG